MTYHAAHFEEADQISMLTGDVLSFYEDKEFKVRAAISMDPIDGSQTLRIRDSVGPLCNPRSDMRSKMALQELDADEKLSL